MAVSFVGSDIAASTSVTIPTHQVGDLIIICAHRHNSSTPATRPSGWGFVQSGGSTSNGTIVCYKNASSTSETSGTWTNANLVGVAVYRSTSGLLLSVGGFASTQGTASANIVYQAILAVNFRADQGVKDSWIVAFAGTRVDDTANTAPAGMTNRNSLVSTGELAIHDTNGTATSWSTTNVAATSITYKTNTMEVYETMFTIPTGGSGGVPLIGTGGLVY
jgi:hypothetical protein